MSDITYVQPKNSLGMKIKRDKIKDAIKARVSSISQFQQLKKNNSIDNELVNLVCNCVENLVKKKYGIDKKSLVIEIIEEIFCGLNQSEKDNLGNTIQFLFDNQLINVVPIVQKAKYIAWSWIKRKLG